MKRLFVLPFLALVLSGCFKEFNGINDENELFAKLSRGNGTWEVTKVEKWNALDADPVITTTTPDSSFFYFYLRSKIVFGSVIDLKYGEYYDNNNLIEEATVSAQKERIVFEGNTVGSGTVYTVEKNGLTSLIWLHMESDQATRYYLEKCNCEIPSNPSNETGG
ncbi:MAG: hypothetical protein HWE22_05305 [Flavobacteriales bacterium]|nr:hypothetical protein [Flavobacteriales bacterium]